MTCIVGCVLRDKVYMGADSFSGNIGFKTTETTPKLFKNGCLLFGVSGSWRLNQILSTEFHFQKKKPSDPKKFLIELMPEIQDAIDSIRTDKDEEVMVDMLVGCNGRLFHVQNDLAITETKEGFNCAGMGHDMAMSQMKIMSKMRSLKKQDSEFLPKDMLRIALEAVEESCPIVSSPFYFMEI